MLIYSENVCMNTIIVSNSLDPDQAGCYIRPDLDPNAISTKVAGKDLTHVFVLCQNKNECST